VRQALSPAPTNLFAACRHAGQKTFRKIYVLLGASACPYLLLLLIALCVALAAQAPGHIRFVILGDRTGEAVPGVYERVLKATEAEHPAFVVTVGDAIQGGSDATAESEWEAVPQLKAIPFYLAPGNHDIWSAASEKLFIKHAGHPPHYSFDYGPAHFTILDNSRTEQFSPAELAFLEEDLKAHADRPLKFIVSHRPSWILNVTFGSPDFELHRLAKKYGVKYVIAGHIHKLAHAEVEGVTYISMQSAGGHLRDTGKYDDGWFFGYDVVEADSKGTAIEVKQLDGPATPLSAWGIAGLIRR
jgi:predicted phosphodiesterase